MKELEIPPRQEGTTGPLLQRWLLLLHPLVLLLQRGQGVPQYTTATAPPWTPGAMYFDTTLNKLRIGGAAGWETVTSA